MENENNENVVSDVKDENIQKYIDEIKKIKSSSVSIEEYNKLQDENKNLLKSLVEGVSIKDDEKNKEENYKEIQDLRNDLFNNENLTNLEFCEKALNLRQKLIDNGEPDPFLPSGSQVIITDIDIAGAEKVAQILKECIDYADGDSAIFTNELMRRTIDTSIKRKK